MDSGISLTAVGYTHDGPRASAESWVNDGDTDGGKEVQRENQRHSLLHTGKYVYKLCAVP